MVVWKGVPWVLLLSFSFPGIVPTTSAAQTVVARESRGPEGAWGVQLGVTRQGVSDELASPLRYRGTGVHGGLALRRRGEISAWDLALTAEVAHPESRIVRPDGGWEDLYRGTLSFAYLRAVGRLTGREVRLYLGGRIGVVAQYRYHQYWPGHSERFGDAVVPLEAAGRWDWVSEGGTRLEHTVSAPVLSLVFRTPYSTLKYAPDLDVAGPSTARGFTSRLVVSRRVSRSVGLAFFHHLSVFHYPDPFPVSWVGHGVGVELELLR